jgi:hypothetical protein
MPSNLKLGERVTEYVVVLVCKNMQLQIVLCYSYNYNMIIIT